MEVIVKYKPNKSSKSSDFRINRRIVQEYGFQEAKRIGALDSISEEKAKHKSLKNKLKHKKKKNNKDNKNKLHIGIEHEKRYQEFIENGGDPNECPFD